MNERINVAELLRKYAKNGEKLYCTMLGDVKLKLPITDNSFSPIRVQGITSNNGEYGLEDFGNYTKDGECLLFPSKDQRDWNKWAEEKWEEKQRDERKKFSVFQRVLVRNGTLTTWKLGEFAFTEHSSPGLKFHVLGGNRFQFCIPYEGNEHLLGTTSRPEKGGEE